MEVILLKKIEELRNLQKRKKELIDMGLVCSVVGPTGPTGPKGEKGEKGDKGEDGSSASSIYGEVFYTSFNDASRGLLKIDTPWLIPNPSRCFNILSDTEILISPGVYEIMLSGVISNTDDVHGGHIYLQDGNGSEIKALSFNYPAGSGAFMQFSDTTILRFEVETTLSVNTLILGDVDSSNVVFSNANLCLKRYNNI